MVYGPNLLKPETFPPSVAGSRSCQYQELTPLKRNPGTAKSRPQKVAGHRRSWLYRIQPVGKAAAPGPDGYRSGQFFHGQTSEPVRSPATGQQRAMGKIHLRRRRYPQPGNLPAMRQRLSGQRPTDEPTNRASKPKSEHATTPLWPTFRQRKTCQKPELTVLKK
jgi:hypothetical protein